MLRSMTGFGRSDYAGEEYKIHVEIKSVNNRYSDISCHMPRWMNALEEDLRRTVAQAVSRGKIDVYVTFASLAGAERKVRVDKNLVMSYHKALNEISDLLRLSRPDTVHQIASYPDVLTVEEADVDVACFKEPLMAALAESLAGLLAMREAEGTRLYEDICQRLDGLSSFVCQMEEQAPQVVEEYRLRLHRLLTTELAAADEARLIQEVALFADKVNFTEEIVRLKSHFQQFRQALDATEAVGRKLDFIVQEMNRETNTIASKANSAAIAQLVVEVKSGIEKIREQIQNIE